VWKRALGTPGIKAGWTTQLVAVDEDKNSCVGLKSNPGFPVCSLVPTLTELSQLIIGNNGRKIKEEGNKVRKKEKVRKINKHMLQFTGIFVSFSMNMIQTVAGKCSCQSHTWLYWQWDTNYFNSSVGSTVLDAAFHWYSHLNSECINQSAATMASYFLVSSFQASVMDMTWYWLQGFTVTPVLRDAHSTWYRPSLPLLSMTFLKADLQACTWATS
jgi:hypothetical protein